jgi:hypothetical protein
MFLAASRAEATDILLVLTGPLKTHALGKASNFTKRVCCERLCSLSIRLPWLLAGSDD